MKEQMQTVLFTLMDRAVDLGQVVAAMLVLLTSAILYWFLSRKVLPEVFCQGDHEDKTGAGNSL